MKRVLFVTWDGPDQSYLESLFLPIFAATSGLGYRFSVLQFRWGPPEQRERVAAAARSLGIDYRSVEILRWPKAVGALASAAWGTASLGALLASRDVDVVMPRSILPAHIVQLLRPKQPVVFDADGLPADERVEFGGWSNRGVYYRVWRDIEARALQSASAVITRTVASKEVLLSRAGAGVPSERIVVVPNGKDEVAFSPGSVESRGQLRDIAGIARDAPWVVFVGSIGPQYHVRELLRFYALLRAREPRARLTILTAQEAQARALVRTEGLESAGIQALRVSPDQVPSYLASADLGVAFRESSFSQRAVSPIKVAEYLLCGLPVLATRGVGDLDAQVPTEAGRLLSDLGDDTLARAAEWFCSEVLPQRETYRQAARVAGTASFSLGACAAGYANALSIALRQRDSTGGPTL